MRHAPLGNGLGNLEALVSEYASGSFPRDPDGHGDPHWDEDTI